MEYWRKKPNVRYVDMAIFIDNNFYTESRDDETCFIYMYHLAKMLSYKKKYFKSEIDYDGFAMYLAVDVWNRMCKDHIKSVLNYMKSILYFRKIQYENETYSEMIDPTFDKNWDTGKYIEVNTSNYESKNKERSQFYVYECIKSIPTYIKQSIPSIYKKTGMWYNIYISSLLSIISSLTLPPEKEEAKNKNLVEKPRFDEANFYRKYFKLNKIILWHLPNSMEDVIKLVLNKTFNKLYDNLKDVIADSKMSEKEFNDISASAFDGALTNEK